VLACAVQPDDQILLAVIRPEDLHVGLGESSVAKTLRHRFGCCGYVSNRIGGIDLDQLLENVVREFSGGVVDLSLRGGREKYEAEEKRNEQKRPLATVQ
jgi:hypothetical protein